MNQAQRNSANQQGGVQIIKNQLKSAKKLKLVLTSDGTGNQGNTNIIIFPGWAPGNPALAGNKPDGVHVTLTSAQITTVSAELIAYLQNVKLQITKMTISTSDTTLWNNGNMITIGKVDADGRVTETTDISFNDYKVNGGAQVSDTIVIDDHTFVTGGNFFMKISSMPVSSNITIMCDVAGSNDNATITARDNG
jgi:hypothetical protein